MYLKSCPPAVECHSADMPSSSTPSSYPHTPGCTVVRTAPVGHILITVAAIAREGESSAITPCAPATRTTNTNTKATNRFIRKASTSRDSRIHQHKLYADDVRTRLIVSD